MTTLFDLLADGTPAEIAATRSAVAHAYTTRGVGADYMALFLARRPRRRRHLPNSVIYARLIARPRRPRKPRAPSPRAGHRCTSCRHFTTPPACALSHWPPHITAGTRSSAMANLKLATLAAACPDYAAPPHPASCRTCSHLHVWQDRVHCSHHIWPGDVAARDVPHTPPRLSLAAVHCRRYAHRARGEARTRSAPLLSS